MDRDKFNNALAVLVALTIVSGLLVLLILGFVLAGQEMVQAINNG